MAHPTFLDLASRQMAKPKGWIKGATNNSHGQFRRKAETAGESTREFAEQHKGDSGKTGKQARLALTLMSAGERRRTLYNRSTHKD